VDCGHLAVGFPQDCARAGRVTQVVDCLPSKPSKSRAMSSNPNTAKDGKKLRYFQGYNRARGEWRWKRAC
jgi:hypothetical protein